jgi:predicted Zn-dependent peptidase
MSDLSKTTLPNGVRVLVEPVSTVRSAAIGLWCKTGSAQEMDNEAGITHLIEHMLFKGTKNRTAKEIAESIEGRGGGLNAFTDKENTCYYCRVLSDDVENGIDVLCDMMRNSLIDPKELIMEQSVVLEEIKRGEDEPGDHVHEVHLAERWGAHPYGKPIIGTRESVSGFQRDDLTAYMDRRYRGGNVLLAVAGNVDPKDVTKWAEERLGDLPEGGGADETPRPQGAKKHTYLSKEVEQVHFCIGSDGTSIYDQDIYAQSVLDAALGGSMSSRLFQEIRERRGLAYAIGSYSLSYSGGGAYTVYGGTAKATWEQVQELVRKEFDSVMADGLPDAELERLKRQICGNVVLALEGMSARMMRTSKNELFHRREIPIEETMERIEAVTNVQIVELARKNLAEDRVSVTAIGPA